METDRSDSHENGNRPSMPLSSVDSIDRELEALYPVAFARLRRTVVTVVGSWDEAADVVQDAFVQAWARRESFRGDGSLESWVLRIALRIAARRASQARAHARSDAHAPELGVPNPEAVPELAAAFRELPPQRRLIVVLRYVGGLSYAEIARATGLSEGTVAGALSKARHQLIRSLEQKGVTP
jgi:RNA polymerase sigma-70 factor (ECF subfamily)